MIDQSVGQRNEKFLIDESVIEKNLFRTVINGEFLFGRLTCNLWPKVCRNRGEIHKMEEEI
jgi:hypothetical protein